MNKDKSWCMYYIMTIKPRYEFNYYIPNYVNKFGTFGKMVFSNLK